MADSDKAPQSNEEWKLFVAHVTATNQDIPFQKFEELQTEYRDLVTQVPQKFSSLVMSFEEFYNFIEYLKRGGGPSNKLNFFMYSYYLSEVKFAQYKPQESAERFQDLEQHMILATNDEIEYLANNLLEQIAAKNDEINQASSI